MPDPQPPRFSRADAKQARKIATGPLLGAVEASPRAGAADAAPAARPALLGRFQDVRAHLTPNADQPEA